MLKLAPTRRGLGRKPDRDRKGFVYGLAFISLILISSLFQLHRIHKCAYSTKPQNTFRQKIFLGEFSRVPLKNATDTGRPNKALVVLSKSPIEHHPRTVAVHAPYSKVHYWTSNVNMTNVTDYYFDRPWLTGWAEPDDSESSKVHPTDYESVCEVMEEWQRTPRQVCNTFHETDLIEAVIGENLDKLGNGWWRLAYQLSFDNSLNNTHLVESHDSPSSLLIKVLRMKFKDFNDETTARSYIDGIVAERVSRAKHALNSYGFCAHSSFIEIALRGELEEYLSHSSTYRRISSEEKLKMVLDMAKGVAEIQYGPDILSRLEAAQSTPLQAQITILDIKPSNMLIMEDGTVKVSDFNNAELLRWNKTDHSVCRFKLLRERSPYKSPEESKEEFLSEKVDIYSLGSVMFFVLTGIYPYFYDVGDYYEDGFKSEVKRRLAQCSKPLLPSKFYPDRRNVTRADPIEIEIERMMQRCHACDPKERPTAIDIIYNLTHSWNTLVAADQHGRTFVARKRLYGRPVV